MSEELRKRVVHWATNYTEMDCNRLRDAKPLMDDLLRRIKALELENKRLAIQLEAVIAEIYELCCARAEDE